MHSGKQTKTTQTCPNWVSSFVRNLSVYKLQKLLFVFLYINLNSPQKSRFYLIIIINYRGVGWLRDDVTWRQLRVQMRTLSSFKKIIFAELFMFPVRIMILNRTINFHTTIYYRRMYVKFIRHKVIMTWNSLWDFRRSWYGARNWRRWTEVDLIQSL